MELGGTRKGSLATPAGQLASRRNVFVLRVILITFHYEENAQVINAMELH